MQKKGIGHCQEPALRSQMTLSPLLRRTRQQRRANMAAIVARRRTAKAMMQPNRTFESGRAMKRRAAQRGR